VIHSSSTVPAPQEQAQAATKETPFTLLTRVVLHVEAGAAELQDLTGTQVSTPGWAPGLLLTCVMPGCLGCCNPP
jgi:hypothetical protein